MNRVSSGSVEPQDKRRVRLDQYHKPIINLAGTDQLHIDLGARITERLLLAIASIYQSGHKKMPVIIRRLDSVNARRWKQVSGQVFIMSSITLDDVVLE